MSTDTEIREGSQMKCMRCGTEIATDAVFCEDCLAEMEKHPVKPGTPVLLPRREKQTPVKRNKKRTIKPEEQVHRLRRAVILLSTITVVLSIALAATVYALINSAEQHKDAVQPGQNYSTAPSET